MGASDQAITYLKHLSTARLSAAQDKGLDAEKLGKTKKNPLSTYKWMRALTEAQRLDAESKAFSQLSQHLEAKQNQHGKRS